MENKQNTQTWTKANQKKEGLGELGPIRPHLTLNLLKTQIKTNNNRKKEQTQEGLGEVTWPFGPPHLNLNLSNTQPKQKETQKDKQKHNTHRPQKWPRRKEDHWNKRHAWTQVAKILPTVIKRRPASFTKMAVLGLHTQKIWNFHRT